MSSKRLRLVQFRFTDPRLPMPANSEVVETVDNEASASETNGWLLKDIARLKQEISDRQQQIKILEKSCWTPQRTRLVKVLVKEVEVAF